jgi:hypothetical protein
MAKPRRKVEPLRFGDLVHTTVSVLGARPFTLGLAGLVLASAPSLLFDQSVQPWPGLPLGPQAVIVTLAVAAIFAGSGVLYSWAATVTGGHLMRRRITLANLLRLSPMVYAKVSVALLVSTLGIILGCVLLIVPGVILGLAWCLVEPASAIEGLGPVQAIRRSADLTWGNRFRLLGFFVVTGLFFGVLAALSAGLATALAPKAATWIALGVKLVFYAVEGPFYAVLHSAIYFELRRLKEGVLDAATADTFD